MAIDEGKLQQDIKSAFKNIDATVKTITETVKASFDVAAGAVTYPDDHKPGMKVPKGGSSCSSCEYLQDGGNCSNEHFQKWNGSSKIPAPVDEYCSDWYEPKEKV